MECFDEVNFNLVPRDRTSTAALTRTATLDKERCPACDNCRNTSQPGCRIHDNGNGNAPLTSPSGVSLPVPISGRRQQRQDSSEGICLCLCPVTTSTTTTNSDINGMRSDSTKALGITGRLSSSPKSISSPMSSCSPSSSFLSSRMASHPDQALPPTTTCLSCHKPRPSQYHYHNDDDSDNTQPQSCQLLQQGLRSPLSHPHSPMRDSTNSLEGLSLSPTTRTTHNSSFPTKEFSGPPHVHNFFSNHQTPSVISSPPFLSRTQSNPDPETILSPSDVPHSPRLQSQPIPIQNNKPASSSSSSSRHHRHLHHHHHHNDTETQDTHSVFPPSHSYAPSTATTPYNPFASSPADRLSLHFYSQQSPKYFKQPSSSCSPNHYHNRPHHHHHGHGRSAVEQHSQSHGHDSTQTSVQPTVFDRWPIGLSSPSHSSNNKSTRGFGVGTEKNTKNAHRSQHSHHRGQQQHSNRWRPTSNSWRPRWAPNKDDGSSGEDDVTMTPVDEPLFPSSISDTPHISLTEAARSPDPCHLPQELIFQLHDLEHHNEDLSAEVIFALESKGFSIHEVLGKGISSTVRRVTEKESGLEYAVKIIDISGEKGDSEVVEQTKKDTLREIQILRLCGHHKNIIHMHDVFETPTFIFLVFELCRQGELFDYLTSVVSLSEKRTRVIMRQLLDAVQFVHENGIVHRDLKPENILMDDDLNIKVSDFGFATQLSKGEELGELCGTPGYLAPEVLAHSMYENVSGYGKEVDMWACGVIMYTLLCGAPPFWNRRQMMMLRAIMSADYTFNSPEWDDISEPPKNLIQKLLVVNPKERLTAREALAHPFFRSQIQETTKFKARGKFRAAVFCVIFLKRLHRFYKHPPPISVDTLHTNPYSIKLIRKAIDTCAFSMYRHWVKRVDNQNRAALFEHTLREEWKHNTLIAANNTHTPL